MANISTLKRCSKCREEKPDEEFPKAAWLKSGLRSDCKKCHSKTKIHYLIKSTKTALTDENKNGRSNQIKGYRNEYFKDRHKKEKGAQLTNEIINETRLSIQLKRVIYEKSREIKSSGNYGRA
jgi:hypothetical protein